MQRQHAGRVLVGGVAGVNLLLLFLATRQHPAGVGAGRGGAGRRGVYLLQQGLSYLGHEQQLARTLRGAGTLATERQARLQDALQSRASIRPERVHPPSVFGCRCDPLADMVPSKLSPVPNSLLRSISRSF